MSEALSTKVKFSIKLKFFLVVCTILAAALSFYVYFALDLFKKDKSAYVYETSLSNIELLANKLNEQIGNKVQTLTLLSKIDNSAESAKTIETIFKTHKGLVDYAIVDDSGKRLFHLFDTEVLERNNLEKVYFEKINDGLPLDVIKGRKFYLENASTESGFPHMLMAIYDKGKIHATRWELSAILKDFSQNQIFTQYAMTTSGELFIHENPDIQLKKVQFDRPFTNDILKGQSNLSGVKETTNNNEAILVGYYLLKEYNLMVFSEVPLARAFSAAEYLVSKSLYFGLFILAVAVIIGVFFSNSLTSPISLLSSATRKMSEGDFSSRVSVKSRDEIGVLSQSFNYMAEKIIFYMEEMKEKVRIEGELKVAKLVQNSFIPDDNIRAKGIDIAAHYSPASECGGDWWGHMEIDGKSFIFIADATGHGVPAALLTATASCCMSNLHEIARYDRKILESPARILSFMNEAVCSMGDQIMLTCMVFIYDPSTKILKYANASHNDAYVLRSGKESITKDDIEPLLVEKGPRLGHQKNAQYADKEAKIEQNDTLVFYTDGIMENQGNAEKPWGQRKFLKSLLAHYQHGIQDFRNKVMEDAITHFGKSEQLEDDMTLLLARIS